jgi:hypothetical protein
MSESSNYLPTPDLPREYLENPYADPTLMIPQELDKKTETEIKPGEEKDTAKKKDKDEKKENYHRDLSADEDKEKPPSCCTSFCLWLDKDEGRRVRKHYSHTPNNMCYILHSISLKSRETNCVQFLSILVLIFDT